MEEKTERPGGEMLKNYMRVCVEDVLEDVMRSMKCCTCQKCRLDVTAIALNNLPAKYVVTKKGELYTKLSVLQQQFGVDIVAAISKAAAMVSRNPRHID